MKWKKYDSYFTLTIISKQMQSYEGEYSHPYIDREYNDHAMKKRVHSLIAEEMAKMAPFELLDIPEIPDPPPQKRHEFIPPPKSLEAKYEDLLQQQGLLEVLIMKRKEYWGGEDRKLNTYIELVERQKNNIQQEIYDINKARYREQIEAEQRIRRLQQQIKDLESTIENTKKGIERLKEK